MRSFARRTGALGAAVVLVAACAPRGAVAVSDVRVAILDSGIISNSEFPAGQVVAWRDFVNGFTTPYDDLGHGTAVASRAAGRTLGAYPGVKLVIGKVLSGDDFATWTTVAEGIRWAADQSADVINLSLWASAPNPTSALLTIGAAIDYATSKGALVVWIAGNGGTGSALPPVPASWPSTVLVGANSPQALVVGATDSSGAVPVWSQRDPELVTPGWDVPILWNDGAIYFGSGTSFAAPWAAGVAARLLADGAPQDPSWLKWVLLHCSIDRAQYSYLDEGYGWLNADAVARARTIAQGSQPVPAPDARDVFHVATAAARTAQVATVPAGALPPL
ncbi:MAG: S8 family peptidase [Actinomycetota bacterium]